MLIVRLFLKFALICNLALTIVGLIARAFGSTQPPNPALRGFIEGCEDKPQPCWYGIVPGETKIDELLKEIESKGYKFAHISNDNLYFWDPSRGNSEFRACFNIIVSFERTSWIVLHISLIGCDRITLGDLSLIGFPEKILGTLDLHIRLSEYNAVDVSQYELFDSRYFHKEWSPNMKIYGLSIGSSKVALSKAIDLAGSPWHGFVPHWRYCQLESAYRDCTQ